MHSSSTIPATLVEVQQDLNDTGSIDSVCSNWILLACEFDGGDSLLGEREIRASKKNRPLVG